MRFARRLWGGLLGTAWLAPLAAATTTSAAVLGQQTLPGFPGGPTGYGAAAGLLAWAMAGLAWSAWASARRANSRSYGEVVVRLQGLRDRLERLRAAPLGGAEAGALEQTARHLEWLEGQLRGVGPEWVNGSGYITVWEQLHRAEETLMLAEPEPDLLQDMVHDELRLKGSSIPSAERLLEILDAARVHLCHLKEDPCRKPCEDPCIEDLPTARAALREVRFSVNEFRDQSWNGLLQLRIQTMAALLLTELAAYALLILSIVAGAGRAGITAGATFFLIGAAIGLFNRLYQHSQAGAAVEDYGLSTARLLTLPVYSGLAAIGGVLISGLSAASAGAPVRLDQIFHLSTNPYSVVVAAVFGIAPGLLVSRLGQASQKYQNNLRSTEAGGTSS